jgi:hypothetical protein
VLFVLSIGLVVLMGVMAVTDALVSAQRNVATQVYMNESTSAAENSLQYAIGLLNTAAASSTLSSITSPIVIPSQITGNAKVTVTMTPIPSSLLYSSSLGTPIWNSTTFPSYTSHSSPPIYILLSAKSQYGTFQRTTNVILGQTFAQTSNPKMPSTAYFSGAMFGNQSVQVNGVNVLFENSYTPTASSYAQSLISSNNQLSLSGSTTIAGSINAATYSLPPITFNQGVPSSSVMVDGNVSFTGSGTPYASNFIVDSGSVTPTVGANVLGDAQNGGVGNQPGNVANTATQSTTPAPQVQAASGAAAENITGSEGSQTTTVAAPSANAPIASLGSVSNTGTDSMTLSSGQYVASSFSTTPDSSLNINLTANSSGQLQPVQIYLQGNSANGIPLELQGNVNMNNATQSASNLQFFYNGTESIFVTMGAQNPNFYGQIYAPNANVVVDTTGGAFHGSVVANTLTVQGSGSNPGTFYYDPRSTNPSGGGPGAAGPGYTPVTSSNSPSTLYVLSWQEQTTGAQ